MTTETLTISPYACDWGQIFNDDAFRGITGSLQVGGRTGNRWLLTLRFMNLTASERRALAAHRVQLRGMRNRLRIPPASLLGYSRSGAGGGTPVLVGAHSAAATSLSVDGIGGTISDWLAAGDLISIGNEMKMVTQAVDATSGAATIPIWPELHQDYSDNASVEISSPHGDFFMVDSQGFEDTPFGSDQIMSAPVLVLEEDITA